jgi:hypothetical protein
LFFHAELEECLWDSIAVPSFNCFHRSSSELLGYNRKILPVSEYFITEITEKNMFLVFSSKFKVM